MRRGFEVLTLVPTPPYRITPHMDRFQVAGEPQPSIWEPWRRSWRMLLEVDGREWPTRVVVRSEGQSPSLQLFIDREADYSTRKKIQSAVGWVFSVDVDYLEFLNRAQGTSLQQVAWSALGSRPARALSVYEALLRALVWEQEKPSRALAELVRRCSNSRVVDRLEYYGQPKPEAVVELGVEGLRSLGFSQAKSETILEISKAAVEGRLPSVEEARKNPRAAARAFQEIRGVGKNVAEIAASVLSETPWGAYKPETAVRRALELLGADADAKQLAARLGEYAGLAYYVAMLVSES